MDVVQGLDGWDPEDDPMAEHAKRAPKCTFVQAVQEQSGAGSAAAEAPATATATRRGARSRVKKVAKVPEPEAADEPKEAPATATRRGTRTRRTTMQAADEPEPEVVAAPEPEVADATEPDAPKPAKKKCR